MKRALNGYAARKQQRGKSLVDGESVKTVVAAVIRVRQVFDEALGPDGTSIAIDLLLAAGRLSPFDRRCRAPQGPTVKQLFAQIPHSSRGTRIHFNRLVADGLLIVEPGRDDRRTRLVRLSARGEQVLRKVAATLLQCLDRGGLLSVPELRSVSVRRRTRPSTIQSKGIDQPA